MLQEAACDDYHGRSTPPSPHVVPGHPRLSSPYNVMLAASSLLFTSFQPTNTLQHLPNPKAFLHQALLTAIDHPVTSSQQRSRHTCHPKYNARYHNMPLTAAHRCQFCGDVLFHDDFFSDPSQHFCLTVNGPGMIDQHANACDVVSTHALYSAENLPLNLFHQIKNSTDEITKTTVPKPPRTRGREAPRRADSECLSGCESDASCAAS